MTGDQDVIRRLKNHYRIQDLLFFLFDAVLGRTLAEKHDKPAVKIENGGRILIANAGHIGDVIISTAILSVLRGAFPGIEIGFLARSYSRQALENHPLVTRVHYLDHWHLSRDSHSLRHRVIRYRRERKRVIEELRSYRYDLAIDLRAWFPNFIRVLSAASIPVRIGYDRVGFGPLLTHRLSYRYDRRHELDHELDLLGGLSISSEILSRAWPIPRPAP
jgi:ADP-heptose:LPS heptosyltransferase